MDVIGNGRDGGQWDDSRRRKPYDEVRDDV